MKPLFLKNVLKGVLVSAFFWALMLLLFTFVSLKMSDPKKFLTLFAKIALLAGAFFGSKFAAKGADNRVMCGLASGLCSMLLLLLFSLILSDWGSDSMLYAFLTVVSSIIGALTSKTGEKKNVKASRKRKGIAKKYASYKK